MTLLATDAKPLSYFVTHEYPFKNLTREPITVTVAEGDILKVGQPLGKITATGKYIVAKETAVDGSNAFGAVLADLQDGSRERTFDTAGDYVLVGVTKGPAMASKTALLTLLDSTYDDDTKKDTFFATVTAAGIDLAETQDIE